MADGFIFVSRIQMFLIFMDVLKEGVRIEDSESTMFADVNVLCGGKYRIRGVNHEYSRGNDDRTTETRWKDTCPRYMKSTGIYKSCRGDGQGDME